MTENIKNGNVSYCIIILIVSFFTFFMHNNALPVDYMESRNLATAQEMVRNGNYLIPTMNGELRLEKPPLPTWIAAAVESISPDNIVLQRGAAGLAATAMVLFLYLLVVHIARSRRLGLMAALVCATSYGIVMIGRNATWDIYCHSFMLGAIYFMVLGFDSKKTPWTQFIWTGVFLGLSFMSKGPVSFYALLLPFLIVYIWVFRPRMRGKWGAFILMFTVFVVLSFWWPIYINLFHAEVAQAVLEKETTAWLNHNVRPFYYYWKFSAEAGIWALFWISSIIYVFFKQKNEDKRAVFVFSIMWMVLSLVLLSIIPEKKTRYLLPILIPGAINTAFLFYYTAKFILTRKEKFLLRFNGILIGVILLAVPVAYYMFFVNEDLASVVMFAITALVFVILGVFVLSTVLTKHIRVIPLFASLVLAMILVVVLCLVPLRKMMINDDRHSIRDLRKQEKIYDLPFYHNQDEFLRMELVYESNHVIRPVDLSVDSLLFDKTPFLLISQKPIDKTLLGNRLDIEYIDTYDNNWRHREDKRYNKGLVTHVAIIRAPKTLNDTIKNN